jgi:membrane fusion protein (multidrug efflux system)
MEQEVTKKKRGKLIIITAVLIVIVSISIFYWLKSGTYESTDNAQVDGNIVPIRSSVTAYIKKIHFKDNENVKQGQLLITFDTIELQAKVTEAKAELENAKANLNIAENKVSASNETVKAYVQTSESGQQGVISAKANLEKAQSNFDRINNLLKIKGATQEQFENAQTTLQIAKSDYARAVNQYQSSLSSSYSYKSQAKAEQSQIELARAVIKQREAELILVQNQLEHAFVTAPCNGVVTKRAVQEGQYTSVGQSLCVVINNDHFWISANFKETQLSKIKVGQKVEIKIDALSGLKLEGIVESSSGSTGAKFALLPPDNATGNFIKIVQRVPVRISLSPRTKDIQDLLFPGLSAFVKVKIN